MPLLAGHLTTDRASRYLVQLCRHASAMDGRVHAGRTHLHGLASAPALPATKVAAEWTTTQGTVTFGGWGRCTLTADGDGLTLEIDAPDEPGLSRIQEIVTRDLERFTREPTEVLTWHRPGPPGTRDASGPDEPGPSQRGAGRPRLRTLLLVLAAVAVVALHLALAVTLAGRASWATLGTDLLLALVVLKLVLIGLAHVRVRRARARSRPGGGR